MEIMTVNEICPPEPMNAEDPYLFYIPQVQPVNRKGAAYHRGYLTYMNSTFREVFDLKQDDVLVYRRCGGWITGHSYVLYGLVEWNDSDV